MMYLVWSNEHRAWWRSNHAGYTIHVESAGRYEREEAIRICAHARDGWNGKGPPSEVPVSEDDALECIRVFKTAFPEAKR